MQKELLVLGLLKMSPNSAYALHTIIQRHIPVYRQLKTTNVYYILSKLYKSGHVALRSEAGARGPSRTRSVYSLTTKGEKRFRESLEEVLTQARPVLPDIEIAAVLMGEIPSGEQRTLLERRLAAVTDYRVRTIKRFGDYRSRGVPAILAATHTLSMIEAEVNWLKNSLRLLHRRPSGQP